MHGTTILCVRKNGKVVRCFFFSIATVVSLGTDSARPVYVPLLVSIDWLGRVGDSV